jgi:hypothetical protein
MAGLIIAVVIAGLALVPLAIRLLLLLLALGAVRRPPPARIDGRRVEQL